MTKPNAHHTQATAVAARPHRKKVGRTLSAVIFSSAVVLNPIGFNAVGLAATWSSEAAMPQALAQEDPALHQHVDANEEHAPLGTRVVFDHGHADLGPQLDEQGNLVFLVRDDSDVTPVWRHIEDVVFHADEKAALELPDDPNYHFIGAEPGQKVWVLPQTEAPGVPWLGWSTQAPSLADGSTQGVNLELLGHQGPGKHSLFLQSGGFAAPKVLWTDDQPQKIWVELNTHTHANWVFSEPGVHLVALNVQTTSAQGVGQSLPVVLKFAIGVDPNSDEVKNAKWEGELPGSTGQANTKGESTKDGSTKGESPKADASSTHEVSDNRAVWWVFAGLAALIVLAAVVGLGWRANQKKHKAAAQQVLENTDSAEGSVR